MGGRGKCLKWGCIKSKEQKGKMERKNFQGIDGN